MVLETLEDELRTLEALGLGPEGAWIETGNVKGRTWRQAWWRAHTAIFTGKRSGQRTKSQYIGKAGGEKYRSAKALYQRRKRYEQLKHHIKLLETSQAQTPQSPVTIHL